jgi:hypothetical protein
MASAVDLAAAYRLVALHGWDDLIFTHISARVPGGEHHFLLNPYGMMFEEVTASSLVKIDLKGNKVMDSPHFINPAGFTIHSAVHEAREDAQCVMHLHTRRGIAVSAQKRRIAAAVAAGDVRAGVVGYHDYEGLALDAEEKPRLVSDFGNKKLFDPAQSWIADRRPDRRRGFSRNVHARARLRDSNPGQSGGSELSPIPQEIIGRVAHRMDAVTIGMGAMLTLAGLTAKIRQNR